MEYNDFIHNNEFAYLCSMQRFNISLPAAGRFTWQGRNRMTENRIFVIAECPGDNGGEITNYSNNKQKLELLPGNIYFMPRDLDLEMTFRPGLIIGAFHFSLELFSSWDVFSGRKECLVKPVHRNKIGRVIELMYTEDLGVDRTLKLRGMCLEFVAMFCPRKLSDIEQSHIMNERYGPMLEFIRNHADAKTGIDDLAEVAGINRDSLSRTFSRDAGIPLKKFLERELVRKASQMLISGLNVRETSEALNFSSEYYFSRFFSKHTGSPPGRYRNEIFPENTQ